MAPRRIALPALLLAVILVRIAAWRVLMPPVESDGLAYVTMARSLVADGVLRDTFGQHVFYSAGYSLLLAPVFAAWGSGAGAVVALNCLLAAVTGMLLHQLVRVLGGSRGAALAGVAVWAVWLPAVWNATMPARENLSTPLLVAVLLCALRLGHAPGAMVPALVAGLCWAAGVLTGGSSLLAGLAIALALGWRVRDGHAMFAGRAALVAALGALIVLGPWLVASDRMVGEPMLNSNAEFNLYLGNNPAATGTFVSIADTPAGSQWDARRAALGEAGSAHWLGGQARAWIAANPGAALRLALIKLGLFWLPNMPDGADFAAGGAVALIRLADVAFYGAVALAAGIALLRGPITPRARWTVAAVIGGFWLIHAAAYVMPRYRDPLAPLLIALAVCWTWPLLSAPLPKRATDAV